MDGYIDKKERKEERKGERERKRVCLVGVAEWS